MGPYGSAHPGFWIRGDGSVGAGLHPDGSGGRREAVRQHASLDEAGARRRAVDRAGVVRGDGPVHPVGRRERSHPVGAGVGQRAQVALVLVDRPGAADASTAPTSKTATARVEMTDAPWVWMSEGVPMTFLRSARARTAPGDASRMILGPERVVRSNRSRRLLGQTADCAVGEVDGEISKCSETALH